MKMKNAISRKAAGSRHYRKDEQGGLGVRWNIGHQDIFENTGFPSFFKNFGNYILDSIKFATSTITTIPNALLHKWLLPILRFQVNTIIPKPVDTSLAHRYDC